MIRRMIYKTQGEPSKPSEMRNTEDQYEMGGTYLSGTRLGEIRYNVDLLGSCERSDDFTDLQRKFFLKTSFVICIKCKLSGE